VSTIDRLVLRAGNNRAWSRCWNPTTSTYTRDEFARRLQCRLSGYCAVGAFTALFLNGHYWGLYNGVVRPDEKFASALWQDGDSDDYCAVSHGGVQAAGDGGSSCERYQYTTGPLLSQNMANPASYALLTQHLDIDGFIDYLLVHFFMGTVDWPTNNWWATQAPTAGLLHFYVWDNEWALGPTSKGSSSGAWVHPSFRAGSSGDGSVVARLFVAARASSTFVQRFGDRAQAAADGQMSTAAAHDLWDELCALVRDAIVGEEARWGSSVANVGRTRENTFDPECATVRGYLTGNGQRLLDALRSEGYYPSVDPVTLDDSRYYGVATGDDTVSLTLPAGAATISGTVNGLPAGATTLTLAGRLTYDVVVRAVSGGGVESAARRRRYVRAGGMAQLRLTELHVNPAPDATGNRDGDDHEYLEFFNDGPDAIDLSLARFSDGIDFVFPAGSSLAAGASLLLASDVDAVAARFGVTAFGSYGGRLRDEGEQLTLVDPLGTVVISLTYNNKAPWPDVAKGQSLHFVGTEPSEATAWAAGSPTPGDRGLGGATVTSGPPADGATPSSPSPLDGDNDGADSAGGVQADSDAGMSDDEVWILIVMALAVLLLLLIMAIVVAHSRRRTRSAMAARDAALAAGPRRSGRWSKRGSRVGGAPSSPALPPPPPPHSWK